VVSLVTIATCVLLLPRAGRAGALARPRDEAGLRAVLRDRSARRWVISELVAYSAWTADLTYVGAFYVQSYGVEETTVGLLLAITSAAFLVTTPLTARASVRFGQRRVVIAGALGMGVLLIPLLGMPLSVWFTLALSCSLAVCAALRVTGSSTLGLGQLPERPGSMMSARTASAQLGYMVGAVAGGGVLAVAGFGTLGVVLFAGLACSALLVARVRDPLAGAAERERIADARAGVPDLAVPD
jgi:predicted MFS family arabinose efflux permease